MGIIKEPVFDSEKDLDRAVLGMLLTEDGSLFVGGTNRGWGSRGPKAGARWIESPGPEKFLLRFKK